MTFTDEEEKEFTPFNGIAFDLVLKKGKELDRKVPCWLSIPPGDKKYAKGLALDALEKVFPDVKRRYLKRVVNRLDVAVLDLTFTLEDWKKEELRLKQARENDESMAIFFLSDEELNQNHILNGYEFGLLLDEAFKEMEEQANEV